MACFVDVETTGLNPHRDEVVELACVLFAFERRSGRIDGPVEEYVGLRQPAFPIPPGVTGIHGITDQMVRGRSLDERRVRALLSAAEFVIAHNAAFDYGFLRRLFPEAERKPWYCSMQGIDWRGRGFRTRKLHRLLQEHDLLPDAVHRADADARAALSLLSCSDHAGQPYFRELLQQATPIRRGTGA